MLLECLALSQFGVLACQPSLSLSGLSGLCLSCNLEWENITSVRSRRLSWAHGVLLPDPLAQWGGGREEPCVSAMERALLEGTGLALLRQCQWLMLELNQIDE